MVKEGLWGSGFFSSLPLSSSLPFQFWQLHASSHHNVLLCHSPEINGAVRLQTGVCKTVSQSSFYPVSLMSQVFHCSSQETITQAQKTVPHSLNSWTAFSAYLRHFSTSLTSIITYFWLCCMTWGGSLTPQISSRVFPLRKHRFASSPLTDLLFH